MSEPAWISRLPRARRVAAVIAGAFGLVSAALAATGTAADGNAPAAPSAGQIVTTSVIKLDLAALASSAFGDSEEAN